MEKKSKISFIIPAYKSEKHLEKCFRSLLDKTTDIQKEIIVVNNSGSSFNLENGIKIINSPNKGFGSACNLGVREASGNIFCFINPDTEIISNDFEKIINLFDSSSYHPELVSGSQEIPDQVRNDIKKIGIIGPKLVEENNDIQEWSAGKKVDLTDIILNNLGWKRSKKIWESKKKTECAWVSGACLFVRKELFEKLNGFDEKFFLYFEDIDLCKRARNLEYKILYYPKFIVKHFGGKSFDSIKEQKQYYYSSQDYYFQKHFGKISSFILKIIRGLTL